MKNKVYKGFFSKEQVEYMFAINKRKGFIDRFVAWIYLDKDGNEILVSEVSSDLNSISRFNDAIDCGEVVEFKKALRYTDMKDYL